MDIEISQDFKNKLTHIFKHYISSPEIDSENNGLFKDNLDFLTTEDLNILLYNYHQKHRFNPKYDLSHTKLIDNDINFTELKSYFQDHPLTTEGQNFKILLKIKKGEPPLWGVHVVPVYIRHEGNILSAFIHDAAFGIMYESKDGFTESTKVIEAYLKQQAKNLNLDYRLIKSSTIAMGDPVNCPIYALLAIRYFIKNGQDLFKLLEPFLVSNKDKISDLDYDRIFHLKADGLPAPLYKYTNRRTLQRINDMYNHEWMPKKVTLPTSYQGTNGINIDILADKLTTPVGNPFGSSSGVTLGQKLALYEAPKQTKTTGQFFQYNHAADRKMRQARRTILQTLTENKVIQENSDQKTCVNNYKLNKLMKKVLTYPN